MHSNKSSITSCLPCCFQRLPRLPLLLLVCCWPWLLLLAVLVTHCPTESHHPKAHGPANGYAQLRIHQHDLLSSRLLYLRNIPCTVQFVYHGCINRRDQNRTGRSHSHAIVSKTQTPSPCTVRLCDAWLYRLQQSRDKQAGRVPEAEWPVLDYRWCWAAFAGRFTCWSAALPPASAAAASVPRLRRFSLRVPSAAAVCNTRKQTADTTSPEIYNCRPDLLSCLCNTQCVMAACMCGRVCQLVDACCLLGAWLQQRALPGQQLLQAWPWLLTVELWLLPASCQRMMRCHAAS